jgi:hypothetical protein
MDRSKWLRVVLIIIGVYWGVWGGLLLFSPGIAENLFSIEITDLMLAANQGLSALFIDLIAFIVSSNPEKFNPFVWAFVALLAGEILLNLNNLVSASQTFQQAGPPTIITRFCWRCCWFSSREDAQSQRLDNW